MKLTTLLGSLFTALCLIGCSGEGDSSEAPKRLVPAKASEVAGSPDYKFERTTTTGINVYVRALTPEVANAIPVDSPDRRFLTTGRNPYFVIPIRDDKIVELSKEESAEVAGFMIERMIAGDPELKKVVGGGGRKQ